MKLQPRQRSWPEGWFSKAEAKKEVSQLLSYFDLDEFAIEAEAVRSLAAELEQLERLLASFEVTTR